MTQKISHSVLTNKQTKTIALLLVLSAFGSACTMTRSAQQIDYLESVAENPRVILMPPDIRYYLLTAGGIPEPHAEWTKAAQDNFTNAMHGFADSIGSNLKFVDPDDIGQAGIEYERLHSAVGMTIINHHFGAPKLPSKQLGEVFDWSLGPGVSELADQHDADYALFVFYRDYQASGGRVAFAILAAAAGAAINTGSEHGFASLVDLRTGDIVWFNVVHDGSGEMRQESGAVQAVNTLFKNIPTANGSGTDE